MRFGTLSFHQALPSSALFADAKNKPVFKALSFAESMNLRRFLSEVYAVLTLLFSLVFSACFANLHQDRLPIGLLDEPYSASFEIDDSWDFWNSYMTIADDGELPNGLGVSSNGQLFGTPTEVGHFNFHISVYSYSSSYWYDTDSGYEDGEWFTVFVTEPSTNSDCPSPQNTTLTEAYICIGALSTDTLEADDELTLDVNYYDSYENGDDDDITSVAFTITYDADAFSFDANRLNSSILREAASHFESTVAFDTSVTGQLHVVVTAQTEQLRIPGRFMDLPLIVNHDLAAGTYDFTVTFDSITQGEDFKNTPALIAVDGLVDVDEDAPSIVDAAAAEDSTSE